MKLECVTLLDKDFYVSFVTISNSTIKYCQYTKYSVNMC